MLEKLCKVGGPLCHEAYVVALSSFDESVEFGRIGVLLFPSGSGNLVGSVIAFSVISVGFVVGDIF